MASEIIDTNVFSQIFKGNLPVKQYVESLSPAVDSTIYVENLQGSKSNLEKTRIKKYLTKFKNLLLVGILVYLSNKISVFFF